VRSARREEFAEAEVHRLPTARDAAYPDWDAIYADNVERIYRLLFSKVGNRPDAEDLTSQVFLTAYKPLRATASVGEVRAYLLATARTVLAEHWRRTLGHQLTEIDENLEDPGPGSGPGSGSGAASGSASGSVSGSGSGSGSGDGGRAEERVARILRALPDRHRAILVLRFLRGYTIRQAAAELGVTVANAKVLQHRALRRAAGLDSDSKEGEAP
jgi:RNA polymerase sigma-70 factor (ECF subfamily)